MTDLLASQDEPGRFEQLIRSASDVDAATEGLFFLPYLLGERSPYWNPAARAAFVGIGRHHGKDHLTRAVLEVAFNLATCIGAFREHGQAIERVDAIGGGAASATWLQILADVWGCTVRRSGGGGQQPWRCHHCRRRRRHVRRLLNCAATSLRS